jgi:transposase-like protein
MPKKSTKRRRYTSEFKAEAVRLVEQRGERTVAEIAQSLGVAENILHAWKRQHEPGQSNDRGESPDQNLR